MQPVHNYFCGLDLGKDRDNSALAILAHAEINDGDFCHAAYTQPTRPVLNLVSLIHIPLGTEYLEVMRRFRGVITKLLASNPWGVRPPQVHVVVDAAGPGQVAVELIRRQQLSIHLVPTLLTGGTESNYTPSGKITVPRRDLVSTTRFLLEAGTLRISSGLKHGLTLEKELAAIRPSGGQTAHDDLAIATGLAAWHATRVFPNLLRRRSREPGY